MKTQNEETIRKISMLIICIVLTVVSFVVSKVIEPKLQIQRGTIIDYELQDNKMFYIVQDVETEEVSQIRSENIIFPSNINILRGKHIVHSTYRNVTLYNIMVGWTVVGILGILVCILFMAKNPWKAEEQISPTFRHGECQANMERMTEFEQAKNKASFGHK